MFIPQFTFCYMFSEFDSHCGQEKAQMLHYAFESHQYQTSQGSLGSHSKDQGKMMTIFCTNCK